jgi:hypothetical protein
MVLSIDKEKHFFVYLTRFLLVSSSLELNQNQKLTIHEHKKVWENVDFQLDKKDGEKSSLIKKDEEK